MPARRLSWSAPPRELLPSVIGRQPVAFAVRSGGLLGARRRGDGLVVRAALRELFDALYEERRL